MNTKLIVFILAAATIITLSLPSLAEKVINTVSADSYSEKESKTPAVSSTANEAPCVVEISRLVGRSYHISSHTLELTNTGLISGGFFKTDSDGMLEFTFSEDGKILLFPDTEIKLIGAKKDGFIDLIIYKGEVEFFTTHKTGRKLRVIADKICVNPESSNFLVALNSGVASGKVVVKSGMLRVTSDEDSSRYFALTSLFCLHFRDSKLQIPHKAHIKEHEWKLNR